MAGKVLSRGGSSESSDSESHVMHVIKRGELFSTIGKILLLDGRRQRVYLDKITARVESLCYGLDRRYVDPVSKHLFYIVHLFSSQSPSTS
jgi:hypothetical protein